MRKLRHRDFSGMTPKASISRSIPAGAGIIMSGRTSKFASAAAARDWELLTANLSLWLKEFPDDSYLVISAKRGWCYVQFAVNTSTVRAEAMSNQYIVPPEYKLSDKDVKTLVTMGWQPPTKPPPELYDGGVIGGSPNFWQEFVAPIDYRRVAMLAIESLRRVYRIAHPNELTYRAFAK